MAALLYRIKWLYITSFFQSLVLSFFIHLKRYNTFIT